jgi:hypothetical protein
MIRAAMLVMAIAVGAAVVAAAVPGDRVEEALAPILGAAAAGRAVGTLLQAKQAALDAGAPLLERWIVTSRQAALADGVLPVPPAMREKLAGFYPDALLNRVRYRIGRDRGVALQNQVFLVDANKAVTLIDLIVFRDAEVALDPVIWAHELAHVRQYDRMGVAAFARLYLSDPRRIEIEAWDQSGYYKSWAGRHGKLAEPVPDAPR